MKKMKTVAPLMMILAAWLGLSYVKYGRNGNERFHTYLAGSPASSINPPSAKTGAPGENNCTQCHAGSTMSAGGVVDLTYSGAGGFYYPDSTYEFALSIPTGTKNGFELTILDENDEAAGTFTAGPNTTTPSFSGRNYVRQSASDGMHDWTFNWTAPSEDVGNVRVYFAVNRSNDDDDYAGDEIFLGQDIIEPAADAGISAFTRLDRDFTVHFNEDEGNMHLGFRVASRNQVMVNIQDLSGRLIQYFDLGTLSPGLYQEILAPDQVEGDGIYIVSLFLGNEVFNRKVAIH